MKCGLTVLFGTVLLGACAGVGQTGPDHPPTQGQQAADESLSAAKELRDQAIAAEQRGDLDSAEDFFRRSLAISRQSGPDSLAVAEDLNGLGDVAEDRGFPPTAISYYQQALAILEKLDPTGADAALALHGLARAANDTGNFAKFEEYALQAFAIRKKLDPAGLEVASSLNDLATVQMGHRDWAKAEQSYKEALAIQEKLAPGSLAMAETLRNLGRLAFFQREYDKAESYHRQALAIRQQKAPGSLAFADSLRWLGLCARNDLAQQEKYYRQALDIQEKLAPASLHVALTLDRLSEVAQLREDLAATEDYDRRALAIWEKLVPGGNRSRRLRTELGDLLVWRGDPAGAEEYARQALELNLKLNPSSVEVAQCLFSLGNIAIGRGNLVAADDYYHQALEITEKLDPGGSLSARMIRGLGIIAENRGDLDKADEYYRRALAIWRKTDPNGNDVAQGLLTVGRVAQDRGDLAQADESYRDALAIWQKLAPESLFVARDLSALGQIMLNQGNLEKAEDYQRRALAIEEKQVPGSPYFAETLDDLGNILVLRGDLEQAEQDFRRALAIYETFLPGTADHAASLAALAGILRRKKQPDEAAQYYQQALDALENQAARLGGGDQLRSSFRATHARYYKDYIDLLMEQKHPELAFQVLERFRARTLLETLALAHADIRKGADPELLKRERRLQEALAARTQQRIQLFGAKEHDAQLAAVDKEIQDLNSQYQEVRDRIRASSPVYAALTQPQPISAKETQTQLLDENTVLLEYSLGEDRSYVWALSRDSLTTYVLPKRAEIEEVAREVYGLFTAPDARGSPKSGPMQVRLKNGQRDYARTSANLSQMVIAPLAAQIQGAKRLLIVSDGALQYIPLAALPAPKTASVGGKNESRLLLDDHEIVNLPSASVLAILRRQSIGRPKPAREVAVLADPVFSKEDARINSAPTSAPLPATSESVNAQQASTSRSAAQQLSRAGADLDPATTRGPFLRRLPFSRREARAIISLSPSDKAMQALDFQASRATAISPELAQYRIVHFATHGLLDSEHPELSGLVFSLVNSRGETENGFLGLEDVYNMNLSADLVVLSACETGLGKEIQGEGLVGLTQGFMYAGAPQVVASLWNVDDAATAELMAAFYRAMEKEDKTPSAALRQAQTEIRRQERWQNPYYWAGFVIHGERE